MKKMILSTRKMTYLIDPGDITYCKSDNSYTNIHTINEVILVSKSISRLQEDIDGGDFIRAGQSYLVNRTYIAKIDKYKKELHLSTGDVIPFSLKLSEVLTFLKE